jgi:hypothetical protein
MNHVINMLWDVLVDQVAGSLPVMKYALWNYNKRLILHNGQIRQMDRVEIMERESRGLGRVLWRARLESNRWLLCINSLLDWDVQWSVL